MTDSATDARIRSAAFEWLAEQADRHDLLPRKLLEDGFLIDGERIRLVGPQGIFKPRVLDLPLSITTVPEGPYNDSFGRDGYLRYRYRGTDPNHRDNVAMREVMKRRLPMVYFHGLSPGRYLASWPVFVVADHADELAFSVAVDDRVQLGELNAAAARESEEDARRRYITSIARGRLHQRAFRERVLDAYRRQCAFCRLRLEELLEAAHIVPDSDPEGEPVVRNGLSLCKLHHAAFDRCFVGLRTDYVIEVRPDVLKEKDGPTLLHSIQALHGTRMELPRKTADHPDGRLVEVRYRRFRETFAS